MLSARRRVFVCGGKCGKPGCDYETDFSSTFRRHVSPPVRRVVVCGVCDKKISFRGLPEHMRRMHPLHPSTVPRRTRFRCPFPDNRHGWNFIQKRVSSLVTNDSCNLKRWSAVDAETAARQRADYLVRCGIAKLVYQRWQSMARDSDDAGGKVIGGLLLRPYALFQLSLDRKDNARPHFVDDGLSNLHFVALGVNTAANVVGRWGKQTCFHLRERVRVSRAVQQRQIDALLERHGCRANDCAVKRSSCRAFYKDKCCRGQFATVAAFVEYTRQLFARQSGFCAVSHIFMDDNLTDSIAFKPSLDAVDPSLGHVRGNLRWVCRFLNSTNNTKRDATKQSSAPLAWTPALFFQYIGIDS